jgi:hypothetical protein
MLAGGAMLSADDRFDRYVIEHLLGVGGMGRVYRARDERLRRSVALKILRTDSVADGGEQRAAQDERLILHEARAAASLDHANTVAIYDVGEVAGTPFIAMELVEGTSLRVVIDDRSVGFETRIRLLTDIARALQAAHERGILHRDVKPENVIVRHDGVVKVLDFGVAGSLHAADEPREGLALDRRATLALETVTRSGITGTPRYMAPEQLEGGPLDGRTDQFAWGVVAYEVLTGRSPWGAGGPAVTLSLIAAIVDDEAADAAPLSLAAPARVAAVVLRALSKRREDRFDSMADVVRVLSEPASPARPVPDALAGRRRLAPLVDGIEVWGRLVKAVMEGFGAFTAVGLSFAQRFGVPDIRAEIGPDVWVPQELWLRSFDEIVDSVGAGVLFNIGSKLPLTARDWPPAREMVADLRVLDAVYHANHRRNGVVMIDAASGTMTEGIGHYRVDSESARAVTLECDNPYPCELDHGILTAIARRCDPSARVEHAPLGCRTVGAARCWFSVTWG